MTDTFIAARLGQDEFLAQTYGRDFLHLPGAVRAPSALVSFDVLNHLLATCRLEPPRLRLSAGGEALAQHRYAVPVTTRRSTVWHRIHPDEIHQRLAEGASLVIDAIDELHEPVGDLAAELEGWLRTGIQVNAYASWTATQGFGTHWDDHDVIVVQIEGSKRWQIFGPTRRLPMYRDIAAPEPPPDKPVAELVLHPGDVLYLPRGWWHAVIADQGTHSLHLTCGITPHTGAHLIGWLSETLRSSELVRTDLPLHTSSERQREYLTALGKELLAAFDDPALITRYAAARDAEDAGHMRPSLPFLRQVPADPSLQVRLTTGRARMTDVTVDGEHLLRFVAAGTEIDLDPTLAPLLHRLLAGGWKSLAELADSAALTVPDVAAVVGELVTAQAAALRTSER
ncbi:cupin domain-containing protein [Streptomyces sp. NPDC058220]|uniref:cupin domain-containing protein n=1 Tax=Streptomyces sp. NPDC058220 TaxID=3346387 RepID=UPI0036E4F54B